MSDDEFDDLFAFSAVGTGNETSAADIAGGTGRSANVRSSSPIDFDLTDSIEPVSTQPATAAAAAATTNNSNSNSSHNSETTGSYYKVSPTTSINTADGTASANASATGTGNADNKGNNNMIDSNLDDDIFDLGMGAMDVNMDDVDMGMGMGIERNIRAQKEGVQEEDFHAMDADTRDFLSYLDEPSAINEKNAVNPSAAALGLDDDDDVDVNVDGVDIDDVIGVRKNTNIDRSTNLNANSNINAGAGASASAGAHPNVNNDNDPEDDGMMDFVDIDSPNASREMDMDMNKAMKNIPNKNMDNANNNVDDDDDDDADIDIDFNEDMNIDISADMEVISASESAEVAEMADGMRMKEKEVVAANSDLLGLAPTRVAIPQRRTSISASKSPVPKTAMFRSRSAPISASASGSTSTNVNANSNKSPPNSPKSKFSTKNNNVESRFSPKRILPSLSAIRVSAQREPKANTNMASMANNDEGNSGLVESISTSDNEEINTNTNTSNGTNEESKVASTLPTLDPEPILTFESLEEAIHHPQSTLQHIRPHLYPKHSSQKSKSMVKISSDARPHLWSKAICGKLLSDIEESSLADSFITWDQGFNYEAFISSGIERESSGDDDGDGDGDGTSRDIDNGQLQTYGFQRKFIQRLLKEVDAMVLRIVVSDAKVKEYTNGEVDLLGVKRDLCSLLLYYYRSNMSTSSSEGDGPAVSAKVEEEIADESLVLSEDVEENKPMVEQNGKEAEEADDNGNGNGNGNGVEDTAAKEGAKSVGEVVDAGPELKVNDPGDAASGDEDNGESKNGEVKPDSTKSSFSKQPKKGTFVEWNPLIGPVAATLLACGTSTAASSVMLSRIVPTFMPLISLTKVERKHAVRTLHQKLYYLIYYHLPLLVLHLDKHVPGWHWPQSPTADDEGDRDEDQEESMTQTATMKGRNLEAQGIIPITWFSSLLAGEGSVQATIETNRLLSLWDILLTETDQSLKFFLALSVLERHSDNLLMLKGQELINELTAVMKLERNDVEVESFSDGPTGSSIKEELGEAQNYVSTWTNHAQGLTETTPLSVNKYLQSAEDEAIDFALNLRSKLAMEKMAARLEAENVAHQRALEEENVRKLDARMQKYYKERLEKFYKKHCPEKLDSVDKIMEIYKDRFEILDKKLHIKYGNGFLPLISMFNPKVTLTGQMLSNVNQGLEIKKKRIIASRAEERAKKYAKNLGDSAGQQVAITVTAKEIMPIICSGYSSNVPKSTRDPLKYYLVDSRPDEILKVQGAFPTAARLSPEELMDPDKIQEKVEMFESLRGSVHICIMGEGFSSLSTLYGHPLDKNEEKLLDDDKSRTSKIMCTTIVTMLS